MNREIKFRAWDKGTNQMIVTGFHVFGETTLFHGIEIFLHENNMGKSTLERMVDVVVMQYTGLEDKNGKEIYEGDVLKEPPNTSYLFRGIGEVKYESDYGGFVVIGEWRKNQHHELLTCDVASDCEVIGNIYQHPELIKTNP